MGITSSLLLVLFFSRVLVLLFPMVAGAQASSADIDASVRSEVISTLSKMLLDHYVFPDQANRLAVSIQGRKLRGEYDAMVSGHRFAATLNEQMQDLVPDKHLSLIYSFDVIPTRGRAIGSSSSDLVHDFRVRKPIRPLSRNNSCSSSDARYNYIGRTQCLPGNIGYLELFVFKRVDRTSIDGLAEAMDALANTNALIIDLRANSGGDPAAVALLSSYLFDQPTHLNDIYWREGDRTQQFWTSANVVGKRYGQRKDVYVLTSKHTFSAAEEFSYNLKNLHRAVIVGETTRGGAHPTATFRISDHFTASIPIGRAINPVTKTNWEGIGVVPDVPTSDSAALNVAQIIALKKMIEVVRSERKLVELRDRLAELERNSQGSYPLAMPGAFGR
jgi:hypothetical protein